MKWYAFDTIMIKFSVNYNTIRCPLFHSHSSLLVPCAWIHSTSSTGASDLSATKKKSKLQFALISQELVGFLQSPFNWDNSPSKPINLNKSWAGTQNMGRRIWWKFCTLYTKRVQHILRALGTSITNPYHNMTIHSTHAQHIQTTRHTLG